MLTVPGSALAVWGNAGSDVTSVTMTEEHVRVPGATDGSTTEGVEVTVSFDNPVANCVTPSGGGGLGGFGCFLETDCTSA